MNTNTTLFIQLEITVFKLLEQKIIFVMNLDVHPLREFDVILMLMPLGL